MHTELTIDASPHRSPRIRAIGGLSARLTGADSVHLIGTAATPLGGDTIDVRIRVADGAQLTVRSVAASLAMPGAERCDSSARWYFEVGAGASLIIDPEPMVVAGAATHSVTNIVALQQDSTLLLRERVQVGRFEEVEGGWSSSLRCDLAGRPLLRHRVELGFGTITHDSLSTPMALSSILQYPDDRDSAVDIGAGTTRLLLAGGGSLTTSTGGRLEPLASTI